MKMLFFGYWGKGQVVLGEGALLATCLISFSVDFSSSKSSTPNPDYDSKIVKNPKLCSSPFEFTKKIIFIYI